MGPTARALLADPSSNIRCKATALVGGDQGYDAERRALLIGMLGDPDTVVVTVAAMALRGFDVGESDLPAELVRALRHHRDAWVRELVRELLDPPAG